MSPKRKFNEIAAVDGEADQTSEEDISFEKHDHATNPQELGRGKRAKTAVSYNYDEPVNISSKERNRSRDKFDEDLAEEIEYASDVEQEELQSAMTGKTKFDAGHILKIDMKDFMCHRKFTVHLGKRLTFIIGKNGSGKSAIVSALQLCLGATARNTGRGTALSTFIREGSNGPASVKVTLVNEGVDAYMPEVYGKRIIVERRISKGTGSAGYHIYSEHEKEITNRKEELEKILRAFNIYVDNPCCILTQEESKKFVNGKEDAKYDFFLKATGLYYLREDLVKVSSELDETLKVKNLEESKLSEKKKNVEDLEQKIELFKALDAKELEIKILSAKIFWREVKDAKDSVSKIEVEKTQAEADCEKAQIEHDRVVGSQNDYTAELEELNQGLSDVVERKATIDQEIAAKNHAISEATRNFNLIKRDFDEQKSAKSSYEVRLRNVSQEIDALQQRRLQTANAGEREKIEEMAKIDQRLDQLRRDEENLKKERAQDSQQLQEKQNEARRIQINVQQCEYAIQKAQSDKNSMLSSATSRIHLIDSYLPNVVESVNREKRFRDRVYGPIGKHITIKKGYEQWGKAVERHIGQSLRSFIVLNVEDRKTMAKLSYAPIYIQPKGARYPINRIPATEYLVLSDILEIDDDMVYNCVVDQFQIERVLLIEQEVTAEGEPKPYCTFDQHGLEKLKYDAVCAITKNAVAVRFAHGNQAAETFKQAYRNCLTDDRTASIESFDLTIQEKQLELQEEQVRLHEAKREVDRFNQFISQRDQQIRALMNEATSLHRRKRVLSDQLAEIEENNRIDFSSLENEKTELQQAIDIVKNNIEEIEGRLKEAKNVVDNAKRAKDTVEIEKRELGSEIHRQEQRINQLIEEQQKKRRGIAGLERKIKEKKDILIEIESRYHIAQDNYNRLFERASLETQKIFENEEIDDEIMRLKSSDTKLNLEKQIRSLKAEIHENKLEIGLKGYTMTILQERLHQAQDEYNSLYSTIQRITTNYELIKTDHDTRRARWIKILKRNTEVATHKFDHYVQMKGSSGSLKFNHKDKELFITYQVDNNDKLSKANDIRNLSGGERSFVTFSLLLAFGHVIECPFRLLDEYDVFLDNITRRLTLDQIQQYAKRSDQANRQFIIITPQDISGVKTGPFTKIIQMPEPVRNTAHGLQQQTID